MCVWDHPYPHRLARPISVSFPSTAFMTDMWMISYKLSREEDLFTSDSFGERLQLKETGRTRVGEENGVEWCGLNFLLSRYAIAVTERTRRRIDRRIDGLTISENSIQPASPRVSPRLARVSLVVVGHVSFWSFAPWCTRPSPSSRDDRFPSTHGSHVPPHVLLAHRAFAVHGKSSVDF